MSLIQVLMDQAATGSLLQPHVISRFTPAEIRESIQQLVSTEQMDLAHALGDAGLSLYPNSEDMLAISGLLATIREDWETVIEHLLQLLAIREERTDSFTYKVLVHALKQRMEYEAALNVLTLGLQHYPDTPELMAELQTLNQLVNAVTAQKRAQ